MDMEIRKCRILNIENYLSSVPAHGQFRVVTDITDNPGPQLQKAGFAEDVEEGASILPALRGQVSRFNAEGKWRVFRDRPKEIRYIRTIFWRWRQWAGRDSYEEHEEFRDIYRECYPRELEPPPGIEITFMRVGDRLLVVSPVLINTDDGHELLKHAINLFLELFGYCTLVTTDIARYEPVTRTVNWRMLPPGQYPWERLHGHIEHLLARTSAGTALFIKDRTEALHSYGPDAIHVGAGGYSDYLAYEFHSRGLVVLESIRRDNALYVFGQEWEPFARLSKAEVLSNHHHLTRIVHLSGWKERLRALMNHREAA